MKGKLFDLAVSKLDSPLPAVQVDALVTLASSDITEQQLREISKLPTPTLIAALRALSAVAITASLHSSPNTEVLIDAIVTGYVSREPSLSPEMIRILCRLWRLCGQSQVCLRSLLACASCGKYEVWGCIVQVLVQTPVDVDM